jgi:DNA-directed RNA polymerase specialized sigma24 family protein
MRRSPRALSLDIPGAQVVPGSDVRRRLHGYNAVRPYRRKPPMSAKHAGRGPSPAAFATLLARLGPDADRAGAAYEHLRRALVTLFAWRGASVPEELADDTLDRLARRLDEGVEVEDVPRFTRGIARLVLLEHWRRPEGREVPLEHVEQRRVAADTADDARAECLQRCLGEIAADGRDLILEYYSADGRHRIEVRKKMARALAVSESALRNRAQRLRDRLERCLNLCLAEAGGARGARRDETDS